MAWSVRLISGKKQSGDRRRDRRFPRRVCAVKRTDYQCAERALACVYRDQTAASRRSDRYDNWRT